MGKGYNNYMCKKPFHPGSKANIKRAWMAEQKTDNEKRKQEELKVQYEKEQDIYNNRALLGNENKEKLELNFMYEAPPGAKRERQKEDDEPEYKFEWQRKYNAPREDYAKGNADIKDQPFGIPVRNVRCIKCHKWGHINTDKECPLYSQASTSSMPTTSMDPMELMRQMREEGYNLKESILGHHLNLQAANQQLIPSDESDPEIEFLKSLSTADKKKLIRKLKKLTKKQEKASHSKKKKSKRSKKHKKKGRNESDEHKSESSSESSSDDNSPNRKKHKKSRYSEISPRRDYLNNHKKSRTHEDFSSDEKSQKKHYNDQISRPSEHQTELKKPNRMCTNDFDSKKQYKPKRMHRSESSSSESEKESKKTRDENKYKREKLRSSTDKKHIKNLKVRSTDSSQTKIEQINSKLKPENDQKVFEKNNKDTELEHPDGFDHAYPQAVIDSNYIPSPKKYIGDFDDRFRDAHRDRRSPSVKQKYKK